MNLLIKRLNEYAELPKYGSEHAAGLDLSACGDYVVLPSERVVIKTGISMQLTGENETEYYGRIAPRSGLSVKKCIDIGAGVIDWDYRGEVMVCLINNGKEPFVVSHGDRIAQLIFEPYKRVSTIQVVDELTDTVRGEGGFGSTGVSTSH